MTDLHNEDNGNFGTLEYKLQTFSTFDYGPIENLGTLDTSSVLSSAESLEIPETLDISETFDIWSFPLNLEEQNTPKLKSWETFYNKTFEEPRTIYISESGLQVFDAILGAQDKDREDGESGRDSGCLIKSVAFPRSLLELGLGRESVLYRYEEHERSFRPLIANGRISGYSLEAIQSLSATFIDHGNKMKRLQSFVDGTQTSVKSLSTSIALASSIATILATVHAQIVDSPRSTLTLLQLQALFEKPGLVVSCLNDIVSKVGAARSEEEFLSLLYDFVEDSEYSAEWVQPTMFQILASVSKPWLDAVSRWVGLKDTTSAGFHGHVPNFVILREDTQRLEGGKETKKPEYDFAPLSMPKFISEVDGLVIFETGKSLRLLETYQPDHLLSRPPQSDVMKAPDLDWQFSWQDIERLRRQAQEYESNLRKAIADFNINGAISGKGNLHKTDIILTEPATVETSEETAKAYIHASIATFERPWPDLTAEKGSNSLLKCNHNESPKEDIFAPPLSLLPILSFNPVIARQSLLINRACLHLLFKEYKIQSHFCLLHRYSLFGDGVFASRLSHALFDPEFDSTERRKGRFRAGVSGLKLGSRDTWPPGSSELRLALMGILTESYYESGQGAEASSMFREELPGGLSFAIRDMQEDELQRCMDPNSIEALDFLKLQYRPPPPLDAVITQASLAKYDVVFRLLLRATRMLFVVNQLFRDTNPRFAVRHGEDSTSQLFRIESHHFVSAICRYFFNGVQANWEILKQRLEGIDKALDRDDTSDVDSLRELRDFHENVLDRLMFTLILRRRQAQVMKLLEEIFSLILVFARHTRTEVTGYSDFKTDLAETYEKFKKKVRVFIGVCRGLSERRGEGGTKGYDAGGELSEDGGNTIGRLLLDFEMSGFYTR